MTKDRINKMLNNPIKKHKGGRKIDFSKMELKTRQKIMTSPFKRYQYFRELYDADRAILIEILARTTAPKIHQQVISLMRALINENKEDSTLPQHRRLDKDKAIKFVRKLTVKKQIAFNERFETALLDINKSTGVNYYLRDFVYRGCAKEADLSMYLIRQKTITIADKAKIRVHVIEVKKQLMLEKQNA